MEKREKLFHIHSILSVVRACVPSKPAAAACKRR
jgi:hypothetical protein